MKATFEYLDTAVIVDDSEGVTTEDQEILEWFESQFDLYEVWESPAAGIAEGIQAAGGVVLLEETGVVH